MDPSDEMEASAFIGQEIANLEEDDPILPPFTPRDQITPLKLTPASKQKLRHNPEDTARKSAAYDTTLSKGKDTAKPESIKCQETYQNLHSTLANLPKLKVTEELQEAWESDMVIIDPSESASLPKHLSDNDDFTTTSSPEGADVQARIRALTTAINARTVLCRDASTRMVTLVQENKHLYYQAEARFFAYVLVPCLKLPDLVQRHVPEGIRALRECQAQVKHGLAVMTGNVTPEVAEENRRLKDRIVEQDALLRESSLHRHQLIKERETLRRQILLLEHGEEYGVGTDDLIKEDQTAFEPEIPEDTEKKKEVKRNEKEDGETKSMAPMLTPEQFRELCVIVERRSLAEAQASGPRRPSELDDDAASGGQHNDFYDGDAEWTLV